MVHLPLTEAKKKKMTKLTKSGQAKCSSSETLQMGCKTVWRTEQNCAAVRMYLSCIWN